MKQTCLLLLLLFGLTKTPIAQSKSVDGVSIVVSDMNTAIDFYSGVLQFEKISDEYFFGDDWEKLYGLFGVHLRKVKMKLGDETIELVDFLTVGGRPVSPTSASNDLSIQHIAIVVSNMDSAYKFLRSKNVQHVSTIPQTLPNTIPEAAGIKAFYFRDPDGHNLEVIYFPKGKGQEKWHRETGRIFLGIDHTAIGIENTSSSHAFYHDVFGMQRKGDSWNKGYEQSHLNNVKQASSHITGYRTQAGVGVEFLEYLEPGPGIPYPADTRADDLWNWTTIIHVDDAVKTYKDITSRGNYKIVSEGIVTLNIDQKICQGFIVRDPDGHAVQAISCK